MQVLYVSAVEGSALFVEVYVTGCVSVLCVCVSVFMCMCAFGLFAQLYYCLNVQTGKQQPSPSDWTETLGPWAVGYAPVAGQENPGLELQEVVSAPDVINKYQGAMYKQGRKLKKTSFLQWGPALNFFLICYFASVWQI